MNQDFHHEFRKPKPSCPKCESWMALRTNRQNGEQFWGCHRYPDCRGHRPHPLGSPNGPLCPKCESWMILKNNEFWGCCKFPYCRGTRPYKNNTIEEEFTQEQETTEEDVKAEAVERNSSRITDSLQFPVEWVESVHRTEYIPEYISVGAMPGVFQERLGKDPMVKQLLSQCLLLSNRGRDRLGATPHAKLISALLKKLLQRGRAPLPTLGIESRALKLHNLTDSVNELPIERGLIGWEWKKGAVANRVKISDIHSTLVAERCPFQLDAEFTFVDAESDSLLQSPEEKWFLNSWIPDALGTSAAHWFTPQASLDKLLEAGGIETSGARRIDFLFAYPGHPAFGIEIDGSEHEESVEVDRERDTSLENLGFKVFRITNDEIRLGQGPVLQKVKHYCEQALSNFHPSDGDDNVTRFLIDCSNAAKLQFAIACAVGWGWVTAGQSWRIELSSSNRISVFGILDVLRLMSAFDTLYGEQSIPKFCTVACQDGFEVTWHLDKDGKWQRTESPEHQNDCIRLAVESDTSPYHQLSSGQRYDIVIRPVFLPVKFSQDQFSEMVRRKIVPNTYHEAKSALTLFLLTIFRKRRFRQMQGEAIYNSLRQKDCVVLLPTGAGKSLIYQLAGLLMPGVTIIVDPIVALIEDQVESLQSYGIERAIPISRSLFPREKRKQLARRLGLGEYLFILMAPERLQTPVFRSVLTELSHITLINLAVIDEAHCVSEWGHDFRPAYLNLGNNLRRFCANRNSPIDSPPLLALTGTASRAVLRDLLADLNIDRNRSDALIRPESFDRPELQFEFVRLSPTQDPKAKLRAVLNKLPRKFGLPHADFYRSAGRHTNSIIVFVPTVNGPIYGVRDAQSVVKDTVRSDVTIYSGTPPSSINSNDWEQTKRKNATNFKDNRVPILVATKAFGMGIDKPNIRSTIHFGLPGSLENFYQEAGRAGRDQKLAHCIVLFSEYDSSRSDTLLNPNLNLTELHQLFELENKKKKTNDDVLRSLWFHLNGFNGIIQDIKEIDDIVKNGLGDFTSKSIVELPFGTYEEQTSKEKVFCRLLRIDVIEDYQVDFGAKKFIVTVAPFDLEKCKEHLLDYIHTLQPAQRSFYADQLNNIQTINPPQDVVRLASILIEFVYDTVERSRRRMIQESVFLARSAQHDHDIRSRLLDYLQEGLGTESIRNLLDESEISLMDWYEMIDKCDTPMVAGELRGLYIRGLESYPDHPGLLLTRAVSEAMCSDHNDSVSSQEINSAVRIGIGKYKLPQNSVNEVLEKLFHLAREARANELGAALTVGLLGLDELNEDLSFATERGVKMATLFFHDERVRVSLLAYQYRNFINRLERPIIDRNHRYENSKPLKTLVEEKIN